MVFPAKSYRFDTVLLLVYVVARLMYLNGVQEKILPKVVTCHNFLEKTMLSQFATQCVANSQLPLHHDHIITILDMILFIPNRIVSKIIFRSSIRSSETSELI